MRRSLPVLLQKCEDAIRLCNQSAKTTLSPRLTTLRNAERQTTDQTAKDVLDQLEKSARSLLEDALKARGGDEREQVARERNVAYASMIEARYGVPVEMGGKYRTKSDLAKVYDALSMVPTEHVMTSSLKQIEITEVGGGNRADYLSGLKSIRIDTMQLRERPTHQYKLGNKTYTLPSLKVATLHEVGHAIDDKAGVMADPSGDDYGGWLVDLPIETVAAAYLATIKPQPDNERKPALLAQFKNALEKKDWAQPDGLPNDVWKAAQRVLDGCKQLANDPKPWINPRPAGGIAYHTTYQKWYGYKLSARKAMQVSDYQWRSPVEWFAELYAGTWMTKAKPPAGVNADAARFLFRG